MALDNDKNLGEAVLYEFEHGGSSAQVIIVQPEDLDEDSNNLLAENLANNYQLIDVPHAEIRSRVRGLVSGVRDKVLGHVKEKGDGLFKALGSKLADKLRRMGERIYPEHCKLNWCP